MAINYNNFIYHIKKGGQRIKKFKCTCDSCGCDRGYLPKAKAFTVCLSCKRKEPAYKEKHQKAILAIRSTEESKAKTKHQMALQHKEGRKQAQQEKLFKKENPKWWCTDEWKEKISKGLIGKPSSMKGKSPSLATCIKISCHHQGIETKDFREFASDSIQTQLAHNLRCRIRNFLNKNKTEKMGSGVKDLGCSLSELKTYLESKFEPWMNWGNYGRFNKEKATWNIDHIAPLSSFDLSILEQFKKAAHYTNLQPMLARENSVDKNDRIDYYE